MSNENNPCWEPCDACDDYICNIHKLHAHECDCKPIEWWSEHGMYPYETTVKEYKKRK